MHHHGDGAPEALWLVLGTQSQEGHTLLLAGSAHRGSPRSRGQSRLTDPWADGHALFAKRCSDLLRVPVGAYLSAVQNRRTDHRGGAVRRRRPHDTTTWSPGLNVESGRCCSSFGYESVNSNRRMRWRKSSCFSTTTNRSLLRRVRLRPMQQ